MVAASGGFSPEGFFVPVSFTKKSAIYGYIPLRESKSTAIEVFFTAFAASVQRKRKHK